MRHETDNITLKIDSASRRKRSTAVYLWLPLLLALCLSVLFPLSAYAKGGDVVWQVGDRLAGKQGATASAVDSNGNVIVTGFQNLGGTAGDEYLTVKFRADGSGVAWRVPFNKGTGSDQATAVVVDAQDNIIVTGYVWNGLNKDIHTVKYDQDGNLLWEHTFDGPARSDDAATALTVDNLNNVYVAGYTANASGTHYLVLKYAEGRTRTSDPLMANPPLRQVVHSEQLAGTEQVTSIAAGNGLVAITGYTWNGADFDCLSIKYDSDLNGAKEWTYSSTATSGPREDRGKNVKIDRNGDIIVTGYTYNSIDKDIFTVKYNPVSGGVAWDRSYKGGYDDEPNGLYLDQNGDVYIAGYTWTLSAQNDILTLRYLADGSLKWATPFNSSGGNDDLATATGIVVDEAGDVFVTGYTMAGNEDFQTIKYKKDDGTVLWHRSFNGSGRNDRPIGIGLKPGTGEVLVAGWTDMTATLDCGAITAPSTTGVLENSGAFGWTGDQWQGKSIVMTSGANKDQSRPIQGNTATTLTIASLFAAPVAAGDGYCIVNSGKITAPSTTVILESGNALGWTTDQWAGKYVVMTSGANKGESRYIQGNTATTLTVAYPFTAAVAVDDGYFLYDGIENLDYYLLKYDPGLLNSPTGLLAQVQPGNSVLLTWQDNSSNEKGFNVYRKQGEAGSWGKLSPPLPAPPTDPTVAADVKTYIDTDVIANTYYYYRVTAVDAADASESHPSAEARALTAYVSYRQPTWELTQNSPDGDNQDDYASAIAIGPDNNPVVTGKSMLTLSALDYYTFKFNRLDKSIIWADRYDDPSSGGDVALCVTVDSGNKAIVSGYSEIFNGSTGNTNHIYTLKYADPPSSPPSTVPTREWQHKYIGSSRIDDRASAVASAVDGSNSVVVVGHGKNAAGNDDIYVIKYPQTPAVDGPGYAIPAWTAPPFDGGGNDFPAAVAFGPGGDIYVTGYSWNVSLGNYDIFTAKYDKNTGALIWKDLYDGTAHGDDRGQALAVTSVNGVEYVYVTGYVTNPAGNRDFVTIKYKGAPANPAVAESWPAVFFDGPAANADDGAVAIQVDPVDGAVVVAGSSMSVPGDHDFTLIRYDQNLVPVWTPPARTIQRPDNDDGAKAMALDRSGNIFVTGTTTNGASSDSMTIKFSFDGILLDAVIYDGAGHGFVDGVVLMIARHLLDDLRAIDFEDDEVADQIEEAAALEDAFEQHG